MFKKLLVITISASSFLLANSSFGKVEVTSSKSHENVHDLPKTVNIIDKHQLQNRNIENVQQLSSSLSNVNISGLGNRTDTTLTIRGVSNYVTFESSTSVYLDDAPIPFNYGFAGINLQNVEKIEVLKGPQGTHYGKNAESGVINIYTNSPTDIQKNDLSVVLGSSKTKEFYLNSSGPINKNFSYSTTVYDNRRDGFTTNRAFNEKLDSRDGDGINLKIKYKDESPLSATLSINKNRVDDGTTAFKTDTKKDPFSTYEPYKSFVKMENELVSLKVNYETDLFKITNITTYGREEIRKSSYINPGFDLILDNDHVIEEITEEVRVNYSQDNTKWLFGGFFSDRYRFDYREKNTLMINNASQDWDIDFPDENRALFSELKYYLDDYTLTTGVRYQETIRGIDREFNSFTNETSNEKGSKKWTHVLPTVGVAKALDSTANVYLTYTKGYRAGGYAVRNSGDSLAPYDSEVTNSYELGYKKIGSNYQLSSAFFYNVIDDLRVISFTDTLGTDVYSAKTATAYGVELDLFYMLDNSSFIQYTLGTTTGEYDDLRIDGVDYSGKTIIDAPDITSSIAYEYSFPKGFFIFTNIDYMGKKYYDKENRTSAPSFTTVNAKVGYKQKDWKAELYSTNIFDKEYVDFIISTPNHEHYHFGAPRVVGVKFAMDF